MKARILHWPERLDGERCYRHGLFRAEVDGELVEFIGRHDARDWPEAKAVLLAQLAEALADGTALVLGAAGGSRPRPVPAPPVTDRQALPPVPQPPRPGPSQAAPATAPAASCEQLSLLG